MIIQSHQKRQIVDITNQVENALPGGEGVAMVFVAHTTAAITTADLDPGTDQDFLDFLEAITEPKLATPPQSGSCSRSLTGFVNWFECYSAL